MSLKVKELAFVFHPVTDVRDVLAIALEDAVSVDEAA